MKTNRILIVIGVIAALLLASCSPKARVGALRTESQSVERGDARSVLVKINMGAGDLKMTGGADKLLEADFTYNVARLKPEVTYKDGALVVQQPETNGMPALRGIAGICNEWKLRLNDEVPMDLSVDLGAGSSNLQLAGLPLTRLDVGLGAGVYTLDLSGDWARNLDVTIHTGAADITVRLPRDVGARVKVEPGPNLIETTGLTRDGEVYTNAAYGVSAVTMRIDMVPGIGLINLDVEEAAANTAPFGQ